MRRLVAGTLIACAISVHAQQPSYRDARKVWDQIDKVLYDTGQWHKKALAERQKRLNAAQEVSSRADRLWPGASRCKEAASLMVDYVHSLNSFALVIEGKRSLDTPSDLYAPMFNAVAFGEKRAACYDEVEALDTSAKK